VHQRDVEPGGPVGEADIAVLDLLAGFDEAQSGEEIWSARLPYTANSTPITYRLHAGSRQFLVVPTGGHGWSEPGDAVIAFNGVLTLDPKNEEARAGFEQAGENYRASKAEREALNNIKFAFRDGEFTSGLRLAYRLPPSVSQSYVDAVKFAGWYNLAVVALRAGDCREAMSHLDEALTIAPESDDAKKLREFAERYTEAVKDRAFLDRVEALAFRTLPAS